MNAQEKYNTMPFKKWDEVAPVSIYNDDTFFHSEDEILEYCFENEINVSALNLVICEPCKLPILDYDFFYDCLPDDADCGYLPPEIIRAVDDFNRAVKNYTGVLSWVQGKFRTCIE